MSSMSVKIPQDVASAFKMSEAEWQLVFSRFVKTKFDDLKEIGAIVSKSKASPKQIEALSKGAKKAISLAFK